jgi:antitoxin FitA
MAQLVVRNLEDDVKARLQAGAKRHRRSLEAEVRDILRNAANTAKGPVGGLGSEIAALFKNLDFDFEIPELHGEEIRPAKFDE